jgi:hypothetical protein
MTTPFDKTNMCLLDSASVAQNHGFALSLNANSNHYLSQCGALIAFSAPASRNSCYLLTQIC